MAMARGTTRLTKAFHTATLLPSGQVMLWGGENYVKSADDSYWVSTSTVVVLFDPDEIAYGVLPGKSTTYGRTQHSAVVDVNGKVLIVGGLTLRSSVDPEPVLIPANKVQWFNPTDNSILTVKDAADSTGQADLLFPRVGAAVASLRQGERIVVAGGSDGVHLSNDITLFKYEGADFKKQSTGIGQLASPGRRGAAAATTRGGHDLLLIGGSGDTARLAPLATTEVFDSQTGTVVAGPTLGAGLTEACAVTLGDGTVLTVGGRVLNESAAVSDASTLLLSTSSAGSLTAVPGPKLAKARHGHSCTLLSDGAVLVVGGVNEQPGTQAEILQDAWVYQPAP
jgi:hypothetical protein